jgi:hypothetical protein
VTLVRAIGFHWHAVQREVLGLGRRATDMFTPTFTAAKSYPWYWHQTRSRRCSLRWDAGSASLTIFGQHGGTPGHSSRLPWATPTPQFSTSPPTP